MAPLDTPVVPPVYCKKAISSEAVKLIYGSKGDMSRRKPRKARKRD